MDAYMSRLIRTWHDLFICDMTLSYATHSYLIWLIYMSHVTCGCRYAMTHPYVTWLIYMSCDSFICAMTRSYLIWLIHMLHVNQRVPHEVGSQMNLFVTNECLRHIWMYMLHMNQRVPHEVCMRSSSRMNVFVMYEFMCYTLINVYPTKCCQCTVRVYICKSACVYMQSVTVSHSYVTKCCQCTVNSACVTVLSVNTSTCARWLTFTQWVVHSACVTSCHIWISHVWRHVTYGIATCERWLTFTHWAIHSAWHD